MITQDEKLLALLADDPSTRAWRAGFEEGYDKGNRDNIRRLLGEIDLLKGEVDRLRKRIKTCEKRRRS